MELPEDFHAEPDCLADRVVLITGAGDGLGRELARACARFGATVVLLGRTVGKLERVYDDIVAAGSAQPAIYPMNLEGASPHDYGELADTLEREFGRLDGLVHCAAAFFSLTPLEHHDPEQWLRVIHTNITAPFLMTQACLPVLRAPGKASVVFTIDDLERVSRAFWGAYGVSKHGVQGLMRIAAAELDSAGIRVNAVDPGPMRTHLRERAYAAEEADAMPTPDVAVPAYLYLLSDASAGVHGATLQAQSG